MRFFAKRKTKDIGNAYPGFEYKPVQVVRFLQASYTFTILLDNEEIIYYQPEDVSAFKEWLAMHQVA